MGSPLISAKTKFDPKMALIMPIDPLAWLFNRGLENFHIDSKSRDRIESSMEKSPTPKSLALRLQNNERHTLLLVGDFLVAVLALLIAVFIWAQRDWFNFSQAFLAERLPFWFWFLPLVWIVLNIEQYDLRRASRLGDTVRSVLVAGLTGFIFYLVVFFLSKPDSMPRQGVAVFIIAVVLLMLIWRWVYIRVFTTSAFMRRMLVIGAGKAGSTVANMVREMKPPPFMLVGFIDDDPQKVGTEIEGYPVLGDSQQIDRLVTEQHITDLVVAITGEVRPETFQALLTTR